MCVRIYVYINNKKKYHIINILQHYSLSWMPVNQGNKKFSILANCTEKTSKVVSIDLKEKANRKKWDLGWFRIMQNVKRYVAFLFLGGTEGLAVPPWPSSFFCLLMTNFDLSCYILFSLLLFLQSNSPPLFHFTNLSEVES